MKGVSTNNQMNSVEAEKKTNKDNINGLALEVFKRLSNKKSGGSVSQVLNENNSNVFGFFQALMISMLGCGTQTVLPIFFKNTFGNAVAFLGGITSIKKNQ